MLMHYVSISCLIAICVTKTLPQRINRGTAIRLQQQKETVEEVDQTSVSSPAEKKLLGPVVRSSAYDDGEFKFVNGGPVRTIEEMDTAFSSPSCWTNPDHPDLPGAVKWRSLSGEFSRPKLKSLFGTAAGPDESSLVAYSVNARPAGDAAYFESCSLACLSKPTRVTLKFWQTKSVVLEICYRNTFFEEGGAIGCQKVPVSSQPGPVSVTLNIKEEYTAIILKASNFVTPGSVIVIDDLSVDYTLCDKSGSGGGESSKAAPATSPRTAAPLFPTKTRFPATPAAPIGQQGGAGAAGQQACQSLPCPFDANLCRYSIFGDPVRSRSRFTVVRGRFKNMLTGIRDGPDGGAYVAVYLMKGEMAGLESDAVSLDADKVLRVKLAEQTQGIITKVCLDSTQNCPYRTNGVLRPDSRLWKTVSYKIPRQTKKIWIVADNAGRNEGAVGLARAELLAWPADGNPESAQQSACAKTSQTVLKQRRTVIQ